VRYRFWVALLLAGAAAACDAPRPGEPRLYTLFDVEAQYAAGAPAIATDDAGLPDGVALGSMLVPAHDGMPVALAAQPSWAESYATAYATTEVWTHFDQIWAQPMYMPSKGWKTGTPAPVLDAESKPHPIFSVGPKSAFYSPYWQVIYVDVPDDFVDGALTSVRQIVASGYGLHPMGTWVAPLAPEPLLLDAAAQSNVATPLAGLGWLEGATINYVQFPGAPISWDADLAVTEVPIFHFVFVNMDGIEVSPDIPAVLGTGPLFSRTPPPVDVLGRPNGKYSAYWRVYTVRVPAKARVFAPAGSPTRDVLDRAHVSSDLPGGGAYDARVETTPLGDYLGRVALNGDCFTDLDQADPHGGTCVYLDSQQAIEENLGRGAITRTDITVTCPVVYVQKP